MSAFVVGKEHLDVLVKAGLAVSSPSDPLSWYVGDIDEAPDELRAQLTRATCVRVGQVLQDENVRSVRWRYSTPGRECYYGHGEDDPEGTPLPGPTNQEFELPYVYTDPGFAPTPGEVYGAIDCFEYQACEHDEWADSEAKRYCDALRRAWCRRTEGYRFHDWYAEDILARAPRPDVRVAP